MIVIMLLSLTAITHNYDFVFDYVKVHYLLCIVVLVIFIWNTLQDKYNIIVIKLLYLIAIHCRIHNTHTVSTAIHCCYIYKT